MSLGSEDISPEQLKKEIELVECVLTLARDPEKLDEASTMAMDFMKTQKTFSISPIELTEYIGYLRDIERHLKANDTSAAAGSRYSAADSLDEIEHELADARKHLE